MQLMALAAALKASAWGAAGGCLCDGLPHSDGCCVLGALITQQVCALKFFACPTACVKAQGGNELSCGREPEPFSPCSRFLCLPEGSVCRLMTHFLPWALCDSHMLEADEICPQPMHAQQ